MAYNRVTYERTSVRGTADVLIHYDEFAIAALNGVINDALNTAKTLLFGRCIGQLNGKPGPLIYLALRFDCALVGYHILLGDRQPQAALSALFRTGLLTERFSFDQNRFLNYVGLLHV